MTDDRVISYLPGRAIDHPGGKRNRALAVQIRVVTNHDIPVPPNPMQINDSSQSLAVSLAVSLKQWFDNRDSQESVPEKAPPQITPEQRLEDNLWCRDGKRTGAAVNPSHKSSPGTIRFGQDPAQTTHRRSSNAKFFLTFSCFRSFVHGGGVGRK